MKIIKLSVLVAAIFSSFSIQAQDPSQSVFVNGTPKGMLGSPVSITVGYDVTDADATLTGLGLRVHYNSSALEFVEFANVLTTDNISSDGSSDDVDDLDGDASTDKFITANWASLFGSWPGSLPSDLLTATFNVADDDSLESTVINFSAASNAAGYLFAPSSYTLDIISGSWDFDGNGTVDALTDGLLMLRHSFNLRGDSLVDGAVATDSTLTDEQVEANLTAAYQIADLDDNGAVDALTDGLMLLRYMFNLRGEQLVNQTVAQDAARTSHADIEQYIGSFMPSDDDTGSGDTGSGDTGSGDTGSGDTGSGDTGSGDTGSGDTGSGDTGSGDTGSGDTGSGDTGSGDTGSGDTGSGDTGSGTEKGPAQFTEAFGGTTFDGELFTFPAAAESWAGFANMDLGLYPFVFSGGGSISFTAAVPSGGSADVKFRFEKNPHPDVDPSYDTSTVTISGATESSYSVDIPSQGNNTFRSLIMYVVDRDVAVQVSNLMVTEVSNSDTGDTGSGDTGSGDTGDSGSGTPNQPADGVISIFGDTYTNVNVTDFNPYWEQQTQVTVGDVLTYANLNYQGTEFEAQDVSTKEFFHVDFYTDNASALEMFVINSPGAETGYSLTNQIVLGQWVSVDIPLSAYDVVDLRAVNQLKVVGDGTVKFDNLYFHGSTAASLPKNVTFSVNMSGIDLLGEVPTIQGTFNGWCGACNPMSNPDGDNIWSLTIELPEASYEYKYALGNWVSQENVPLDCVNSIGANRSFTMNGDTVLATDAYNGCPGEVPTLGGNVTFSVDMTGVDLGGEVPTLQGGFNNWCGSCAPLSDDNGDNVWTITTNLAGGEHQYKYALGAWVSSEAVPENCAHTIGANRSLYVTGDAANPTDVYNACPSDFTGVTDPGTGGDTGGTDPVYTPADGFVITEAFGGTTIGDGTLLTFPTGAESWAGFANMNTSLYPISLSQASLITFTAAIPAGGSADVRFRFEKNPHPDVDPAFDTASVTVIGDQAASYSISVPSQGNNAFRSFIVYLDTRDVAVEISDIAISVDPDGGDTGSGDTGSGDTGSGDTGSGDTGSGDTGSGDTGSGDTGSGDTGTGDTGSGDTGSGSDDFVTETVGPANFIEAFGGTTIQGDEFTHPSSAEPWAGIANMDLSLYPLSFADGGSISFTGAVPSGGSVNVQFKFEFNSHPDTEPSYSTAFTTISGSADQTYTIQIPSQGIKTFSNLIFYIQERNTAVKIADLMITTTTDPDAGNGVDAPDDYNTLSYGAGSIGDAIYTSNHRCKSDYGYWVENAGVISTSSAVQALGCNQSTGIPTGNITKLYPQLTGPAASKPTQTHKWWGSISFLGEMTVGDYDDSAYITPDPISARINNKGARVGGIPSGLRVTNPGQYYYPIGDHAAEVFDGIAVGNSAYSNLEAFTKDHSEGSVTVLWKSGSIDVMEATFVHGSPYVYFKAYAGNLEVRTLRQDGVGEKGTFSTPSNMLGIWTNVAGAINNFLIVGEGSTSFPDLSDNADPMTMGTNGVINSAKEMTLVYLPHLTAGSVSSSMINQFASAARNKVAAVNIDYAVDSSNNEVTVTHSYVDEQGAAVDTIAGMHPLHWKNASQATTPYQIRSARGTIKFAELSQFSYQIPYVGVLPTLPSIDGSFDQATLAGLVTDFVNQGSNVWNTSAEGDLYEDTYWSGKNYGKVAEVSAIARSIGMTTEANDMIDWLKAELSDWFSSEADGVLKTKKYFVYDSDWNTLLGFDEAYGSHQRLADHHFHYGYFVRAAAEICRVDLAWCGQDQYGPMIELLIRDYAADKDDPMFPHMRNFDPANGFSWADGKINFIRGNNNESTSEAATAYGAIILYGLATGNTELTEKGMYLHASTGATYWEYWNNIDGYNNVSAESNNFFPGYAHITTSIIWGDGVDFATWFSGAYAHILGIQGLPSSPLIFHVGLHADYMEDYVNLGLSESSNNKPSGLVDDQWRDLWWNLWAMTDASAAIADYNSVSSYVPEQGESKAHTYHWIHTFDELGHLATGTGDITANHPAAIAFDKNGTKSYVVYNFTDQTIPVTFKQGNTVIHTMNATPFGFTVE
jgi:endoglucanase Acf2